MLTAPYLYLDLREGYGISAVPRARGTVHIWEENSPSEPQFVFRFGEFWMQGTGPSHSGAVESSLSQILESQPQLAFHTAPQILFEQNSLRCHASVAQGLLRRAEKRGKELPPMLKTALEIQAGLQSRP